MKSEALDLLPEELREPAVAFLLEQAEKFRVLKKDIDKGLADIERGMSEKGTSPISCGERSSASRNPNLNENHCLSGS